MKVVYTETFGACDEDIQNVVISWVVKWSKKPVCLWGKHRALADQTKIPFPARPSLASWPQTLSESQPLTCKRLLWHLSNLHETPRIVSSTVIFQSVVLRPAAAAASTETLLDMQIPSLSQTSWIRGRQGGSGSILFSTRLPGDSDAYKILRTTAWHVTVPQKVAALTCFVLV